MQELLIKYDAGWMRINIKAFFPCVRSKSRVLFPLIANWCSQETISELLAEMEKLKVEYASTAALYRESAERGQREVYALEQDIATDVSKDRRKELRKTIRLKKADVQAWNAEKRHAKLLCDRTIRNIAALRKEAGLGIQQEK